MVKNQSKKKKRGQVTLEFILLVAGIIAFLIVFLRPSGLFQNAVNRTFAQGTNGMEDMANRLTKSHPTSP